MIRITTWVLAIIALRIFCGTVLGESMWGWIAAYWMIVSAKWLVELAQKTE